MPTGTETLTRFWQLVSHANSRIDDVSGPVEPPLNAVLLHVLAHPESRHEFAAAFIRYVRESEGGSLELIEYCMHQLRWQEVQHEIVSLLRRSDSERVSHELRKVLCSFDDDWDAAGFYTWFAKGKPS